jgi:hypothetical protein
MHHVKLFLRGIYVAKKHNAEVYKKKTFVHMDVNIYVIMITCIKVIYFYGVFMISCQRDGMI